MHRVIWLAVAEMQRKAGIGQFDQDLRERGLSVMISENWYNTVSIKRPCAVVVSAHVSCSERKPAPLPVMVASVFNGSRVDRASPSRRVTISTSLLAS
jgi:hypothetical protein